MVPAPSIRLFEEEPAVLGINAGLHEEIEGIVNVKAREAKRGNGAGEIILAIRVSPAPTGDLPNLVIAPGEDAVMAPTTPGGRSMPDRIVHDGQHRTHPRMGRPQAIPDGEVRAFEDPRAAGPEMLSAVGLGPAVKVDHLGPFGQLDAGDLSARHSNGTST